MLSCWCCGGGPSSSSLKGSSWFGAQDLDWHKPVHDTLGLGWDCRGFKMEALLRGSEESVRDDIVK